MMKLVKLLALKDRSIQGWSFRGGLEEFWSVYG